MIEILTKFNPYAMLRPTTKQEYLALVDEAILLVDDLHEMLDATTKYLENKNR